VGGVRELLGETGRTVPAKAPELLAEAMLQTMQDPESARIEAGRSARQRIQKHFSMEVKADEWVYLYRNFFRTPTE
jgi:glycosyltransferase involved in cell wall biosynthesis